MQLQLQAGHSLCYSCSLTDLLACCCSAAWLCVSHVTLILTTPLPISLSLESNPERLARWVSLLISHSSWVGTISDSSVSQQDPGTQ